MVTKRILLFGGTGQVGQALQYHKPADWQMGVCTRAECDLLHAGSIGKAIQDFAPDIVINAAAMKDIEACEQDYATAMRVNFEAVATMAAHCAELSAPLIQISTDYVFDGTESERPYQPDDAMNPVNAYGKSKLMGEEAARHGTHWHVILRTALVFSTFGNNVLTKIVRQIDTQDEIKTVVDQVASPTSAEAVAEALITISNAIWGGKADGFGTYHLTGSPAVTRHAFTQAVMDAYAPYTERRPALVPVRAGEIARRVPRPLYSALDNEKIGRVYGIVPRLWRDDLAESVKSLMEKKNA